MNLLLLTFSINNYNKYKNLDIIKQKSLTINKINDILKKKFNINIFNSNLKYLEICCGYGLSTIGLKLKKIIPLSIDNNKEDLSIGFYFGFLNPKKTICLDIQLLSYYLSKNYFDICFGFMIVLFTNLMKITGRIFFLSQ